VVSLVLTFLRTRIFGAWTNHYLEPFAAACVLTGLLVQDLATCDTQGMARWIRGGWLAATLGISIGSLAVDTHQILQARAATAEGNWNRIVARIGQFDDPLLSEDGYLMVRSGRTPFMTDPNYLRHLQGDGKFDDADLVNKIRQGGFAAIVTRFPIDAAAQPGRTFPRRWLEPMHVRYHLVETDPVPERGVTFYVYRSGQHDE